MHTPEETRAMTGLSSTSLRRYSELFAEWLSPFTQPPITEDGSLGARQFTERDVALLAAIKREYDAKRKTSQIQEMLRAGTLQAAVDVVVRNIDTVPATIPAMDGENPAMARFVAAMAGLPVEQLVAIAEDLRTAVPALVATEQQMTQTQAQLQTFLDQQDRISREIRYSIEELRQERRALEDLRAEIVAERSAVPESPPETPSLGSRMRRLLRGGE